MIESGQSHGTEDQARRRYVPASIAAVAVALIASACGSPMKGAQNFIHEHTGHTTPTTAPPLTVPESTSIPPHTSTAPATTSTTGAESAAACVARLPLNFKIGRVISMPVYATKLIPDAALFRQYEIGGVVIMDAENPAVFKRDFLNNLTYETLNMVDEEGGEVQREKFANVAMPSEQYVATHYTRAGAEAMAAAIGKDLKSFDTKLNLAPVTDIERGLSTGPIGKDERSFGTTAVAVDTYGAAYITGLHEAGVESTLKHFPGIGDATGNTDFVAATDPTLYQLQNLDLIPYQYLINYAATHQIPLAVMMSNAIVPGMTEPGRLASFSPAAVNYLRNTLGFRGLIVTDSLGAAAIAKSGNSQPEAAVKALEAGVNMVLLDASDIGSLAAGVTSAIQTAVSQGQLPIVTLNNDVAMVLNTQGLSPCAV